MEVKTRLTFLALSPGRKWQMYRTLLALPSTNEAHIHTHTLLTQKLSRVLSQAEPNTQAGVIPRELNSTSGSPFKSVWVRKSKEQLLNLWRKGVRAGGAFALFTLLCSTATPEEKVRIAEGAWPAMCTLWKSTHIEYTGLCGLSPGVQQHITDVYH